MRHAALGRQGKQAAALESTGGARVTIHPGHDPELRSSIRELEKHREEPCCKEWDFGRSHKLLTLLKWPELARSNSHDTFGW